MAKPYGDEKGVISVESGYSGGDEKNPSYDDVKKQMTGHRETVKIEFDGEKTSFFELLQVYFYNIDPFDDGGQFIDRGHSYTCAVYYVSEEQKEIAEKAISDIEKKYGKKVFVAVEKFKSFYKAEEYHQNFAKKNPEAYDTEYISSGRKDKTEFIKLN